MLCFSGMIKCLKGGAAKIHKDKKKKDNGSNLLCGNKSNIQIGYFSPKKILCLFFSLCSNYLDKEYYVILTYT